MIVLLGASGYIGQAFAQELSRRESQFAALSRKELNYTRFEQLLGYLRRTKPEFLINAAGFTGAPNVDACEIARAETLAGNTLFPQTVAHACLAAGIPWGHVSSGCIYSGAKIREGSVLRTERDLTKPEVRALVEQRPDLVEGFSETDAPNFTFRQPPCSFYSGTKALAEEAILGLGECYVWRLRIPFDQFDNARNYLTKIQRYPKVYDNVNSLSHRGDFVRACLDLWDKRAPVGIYNVTNPGFVTTRQVVEKIQALAGVNREFEFWSNDDEFYRLGAKAPRSNCVLDVSKLLASGVRVRSVDEALDQSLRQWRA